MRRSLQFLLLGVYAILVGVGFYLLATSQTGASIVSPWQTIRHSYIYVFGVATLIVGLLVWFSHLKSSHLLILLVLHSLLLHSYLPLTHTLLYGADQWRHIGSEMRIVQGLPFKDAATGSVASLPSFIGQISYSSLWYLSIAKAFGVQLFTHWDTLTSLIFVSKWLQVLWWSLTVPLLLYFFGKALGWSGKQSLLFSWLGLLPFPFQYGGSVLVPVHFGFPIFLLGIILLTHRLQSDNKKWLKWLLLVGVLMLFGYLLYAVLFWVGWVVCEVLRSRKYNVSSIKYVIGIFVAFGSLPVLELLGRYTSLNPNLNLYTSLKTIFTNFTVLDLARGTSLDYLNGNIIFNQVPSYALVSNIFTVWRWWILVCIFVFWVVSVLGARTLWKQNDTVGKWLVIFGGGLFANYIVSRYFLVGEQILTRRLDTTLALFFLIYFTAGLFSLMSKIPVQSLFNNFSIIFLLTILITVSYSLGPDTMVVSSGEYAAASSVWREWLAHRSEYRKPCVVANTNTLLALEAMSGKEIVGGGFPINNLFAQPELGSIYKDMSSGLSIPLWKKALQVTGARGCWFVTKNNVGYNVVVRYHE